MWALGVICYILLSGFSPFMGDNDAETYINISSVTFDYDCEEFDEISDNAKVSALNLLMLIQCLRVYLFDSFLIDNQILNQDFINSLLKKDPGSRMKAEMVGGQRFIFYIL